MQRPKAARSKVAASPPVWELNTTEPIRNRRNDNVIALVII